ncbi:hypothetical protein [Actinacidiphila paucisporea]|uniref:Regulatory protein n=1 Tax=Actinacidiphila paucisporea TaxID=310782 RepID=A0A1M7M8S8_9ACTN|nr:hypothetical protein [Actinacidiphila paucisporea]SHM87147.1 hypothetical protein SAMN05216499_115142 [Actinacidiphila paucisporea]
MADNATLKSQYLAQIEADLERTAKEKQRLSTDLAALQEQLATLEQDHTLLLGVQQALVAASSSPAQEAEPAAAPADLPTAAVPRPRKPAAAPRTPKQATAKQAAAKQSAAKTKTASAPRTGTNTSSQAPTLVELVVADLTGHSEPRSAAEVTTALAGAHPDRKIQTTVVRNTLEALVAKGQSLRSKQGRSVYYSATQTAPAAGTTADTAAATA